MFRITLMFLAALFLTQAAAIADPLAQRVSFRAMQKQDPELTQAVSVVIAKGFLAEIAEEIGATGPSPGDSAAQARTIQKIAMRYVKENALMGVWHASDMETTRRRPKKITITRMEWEPGEDFARLEFRLYFRPGLFDSNALLENEVFRVVDVDVRLGQVTEIREGKLE
jgi:hypothetical protein